MLNKASHRSNFITTIATTDAMIFGEQLPDPLTSKSITLADLLKCMTIAVQHSHLVGARVATLDPAMNEFNAKLSGCDTDKRIRQS
jgi:hypothetical protein